MDDQIHFALVGRPMHRPCASCSGSLGARWSGDNRTTKLRLYARAGVREYWVVSVAGEWIEVYRSPEGDGYRERRRPGLGERVTPAAFADVGIDVDEVFA